MLMRPFLGALALAALGACALAAVRADSGYAQASPSPAQVIWSPTAGGGSLGATGAPIAPPTSGRTPGGGGGTYTWFDIAGAERDTISWPGDLNERRDRIVKGGPKVQTLVERSLSRESRFRGLLWANTCYTGTYQGAATTVTYKGQPACKTTRSYSPATFPFYREIHSLSPHAAVIGVIDQLAAWNVTVWREGSEKPIFERRIGLNLRGGGDTDWAGLDDRSWWRGGPGGSIFSAGGRSGGPLGPLSEEDVRACRSRLTQEVREFENIAQVNSGKRHTYRNAAWIEPSRLPRNACYWTIGGPNSGEAIRISWTTGITGGAGAIDYRLQGRPGYFYAVRITAIDHREQLLVPTKESEFRFAAGSGPAVNYFRVFISSARLIKRPPDEGCCDKKKPVPRSSPPPEPVVSLVADNPVPTRIVAGEQVTVSFADLQADQALFVKKVRLFHYTPQLTHNGASGPAYGLDYVDYDVYPTRLPSPFPPPKGPEQIAMLQQPAFLNPFGDAVILSLNTFGISWLRPTLENPCDQQVQAAAAVEQVTARLPRPVSIDRCQSPNPQSAPFNAWDDYLEASATYEARWLAATSSDRDYGDWIEDQPLRCNQTLGAPPRSIVGCRRSHQLANYPGRALDRNGEPLGTTQRAQGYVYATPSEDERWRGNEAAVGFILKTNRPDLIREAKVWSRDLPVDDENVPPLIRKLHNFPRNSVTGFTELWFCTPGLPPDARIDVRTPAPSDDVTVRALDLGRASGFSQWKRKAINDKEACSGYAAAWKWDEWSSSWSQPWGNCKYNRPAPRASTFPRPTDERFADQVADHGRYSDRKSYSLTPFDYRPLLRDTVPYLGLRPGNKSIDGAHNVQEGECYKLVRGHYRTGSWTRIGSYQVVVGYTPAGRQYVCRVVGGRIRCSWQQTPPQPIYQTVNRWSWRWSGACYPPYNTPDATPSNGLPYWSTTVSSAADTNYVPFQGNPATNEIVGDAFADNVWGCDIRREGRVQNGEWTLGRKPGPGWGRNLNGEPLPEGGYMVDFVFRPVPNSAEANTIYWELAASYMGQTGWNWLTQHRLTTVEEQHDAAKIVSVYGTRATR